MTDNIPENINDNNECQSCDPTLTRKDFLRRLLSPAVGVGIALAAPRILDKMLIPKAMASSPMHNIPGGHPLPGK